MFFYPQNNFHHDSEKKKPPQSYYQYRVFTRHRFYAALFLYGGNGIAGTEKSAAHPPAEGDGSDQAAKPFAHPAHLYR
jgi:hypothetical protein